MLLNACSSSINKELCEKCTITEINSSVQNFTFGNEKLKVNFIDLDSLLRKDLHNRTSPLNAYFYSNSKFEVNHLKSINIENSIIEAGIELPNLKGIIVYSSSTIKAGLVNFENTKGILVYHLDDHNQLMASLFGKKNSEFKMIGGLHGYVGGVEYSHIEKASTVLPFELESYKSALFLLNSTNHHTKKANESDFESKISKYIDQNVGTTEHLKLVPDGCTLPSPYVDSLENKSQHIVIEFDFKTSHHFTCKSCASSSLHYSDAI